jgi:hypothetical protein
MNQNITDLGTPAESELRRIGITRRFLTGAFTLDTIRFSVNSRLIDKETESVFSVSTVNCQLSTVSWAARFSFAKRSNLAGNVESSASYFCTGSRGPFLKQLGKSPWYMIHIGTLSRNL